MKYGINIKIDVTKLDKSKFFQGASGALYCDLTAFVDMDNVGMFGDNGMVTQSQSQTDRQAGLQMPPLGNAKKFWEGPSPAPTAPQQYQQQAPQQQAPQLYGQQAPLAQQPLQQAEQLAYAHPNARAGQQAPQQQAPQQYQQAPRQNDPQQNEQTTYDNDIPF
jgi:hypothetical protein